MRWFAALLSGRATAGHADRVDGQWCALYAVDDDLLFQAGKTICRHTEYPLSANVRDGNTRRFTLRNQADVGIELEYRAKDRDWDPLFDGMDLVEIDFLAHVSIIWSVGDWRDLAKRWTEAQR